ncbi:TNF receptor-associated factor 5-like [Oopsacas minuta]|uniref:TNF receptor-associated factor 5-like n=1 Tax=Oopsacas minuta TaxID=111878 RepID=A0AAV7K9M1_9METZ|nr:TNF receptor-associated factor 5-like [Oopsacas minuta]
MAVEPDDNELTLYTQVEIDDKEEISYRGYKKDYLSQNLTEMEYQLIICPLCKGIMRDACAYQGEITCMLCSQDNTNHNPVIRIRELVAKLGIKCPLLRECNWTGELIGAEDHLLICESSLILCPLECKSVVKRCEIDTHTGDQCELRKVECEFCKKILPFRGLISHLEICPSHPIKCECGNEFQRCKQEAHIETECPLAEVECPYAIYSCGVGKMFRKELLAHKKDFYIEHQDLLQSKFEEENHILREKLKTKKDLDGFEWEIYNFSNFKFDKDIEGPTFFIGNYEHACVLHLSEKLNIKILRLHFNPKERMEIYIIECRLVIDKTIETQESYFETKMFTKRIPIANMVEPLFALDKTLYSKYIQKDGCLRIKMYFDYVNSIRKKDKDKIKSL